MPFRPESIYIYYISGTGNAKASAEWIADEAEKAGVKVLVQRIDKGENLVFPAENENTLIGFAFPTHGFNAAPSMLKFISGFPSGLCRNIFLLNTRAGMKLSKLFTPGLSGMALLLPALILRMKGYRCTGYRPVDMPSNWISLHPGIKKKVIDSIAVRCESTVRDFANKILGGKKVWRGLYSLPVDLLISPLTLGYYVAGRYFLSKTFIAGNRCNNCGLCIKQCPTGSIRLVNNRPYWKLSCESCMRCMNNCPERAIETAHGLAVGFYLLIVLVNSYIGLLLAGIIGGGTKSSGWIIATQVSSLLLTVLIPLLVYRIVHYAMYFKPVRSVLRLTSLTALPFWRRYKFVRSRKN